MSCLVPQAALLNARLERDAAGDFANALLSVLPALMVMDDVTDVDRAVRMFASRYVTGTGALQFMSFTFPFKNIFSPIDA